MPPKLTEEEDKVVHPGGADAPPSRTPQAPLSAGKHTPIPAWHGYFATADGRIWSSSNWRGYGYRELQRHMDRDSYPCVRLTGENGTRKRFKVHVLIATTFLGPRPTAAHEVRHLDGDRANGRAANLAWGTRAENAADREAHGRTSRGQPHAEAIRRGISASTNAFWRHAR